jgi:class 3 adenylate cyclase
LGSDEWHGIMERFFRILADGVHHFEGTVNQYTGDGIMALFGAPIAHGDHGRRTYRSCSRITISTAVPIHKTTLTAMARLGSPGSRKRPTARMLRIVRASITAIATRPRPRRLMSDRCQPYARSAPEIFAAIRVSVEMLVRRPETVEQTIYLGEVCFDLAAPSV